MTKYHRHHAAFRACAAFLIAISGIIAVWAAAGPWAVAQETGPSKRALLVGINEYRHGKLAALAYAENDARAMAELLRQQGYVVEVVTGKTATKKTVDAAIDRVLAACVKGDTVLVGMSGHGLQFFGQKDAFYVPVDGLPFKDETQSLVSLNRVYERLEKSFAGIKVLLVDACRDDPNTTKGIDADTAPRPPQGVAALFSCKAGERSFEHKTLQHGVFFHHVLEGLRGKAVDTDGEVTFAGLAAYVTKNVSRTIPQLIDGAKQSPNMKADYSAEPVLAKLDLKPVTPLPTTSPTATAYTDGKTAGEERTFSDLKFKMNWCPPGTFTMGSPRTERDRDPDEEQVEVTLSRGFWLGQTEVTQGVWQRVMGTTPWKGKTYVKEGENYPATYVLHGGLKDGTIDQYGALEFCRKLTDRERKSGRLPVGMEFRLPTEAEWEYACRAGTKTTYSFSDESRSLSDYAWWGGILGDGNAQKFAQEVGQKRSNPWGLCDMHGNVWEWCEDWYADQRMGGRDPRGPSEGTARVRRGGGWDLAARYCRSAIRFGSDPELQLNVCGFRIALSPSK